MTRTEKPSDGVLAELEDEMRHHREQALPDGGTAVAHPKHERP